MTGQWGGIRWLTQLVGDLWDVLQAAGIILGVLYVIIGWVPGPRLIMRTLFEGQLFGPFRALKELAVCLGTLGRVAPTHLVRPRSVRRAVRVWIERAVFDARPKRVLPEGKPWQVTWLKEVWRHRRTVSEWKARRRHALDRLLHGRTPVEIPVATCFALHKAKDTLTRYFETLRKDRAEGADHFMSTLRIETAYLAPLHLVAGLLANFEDEWVPVINDFGRALTRRDDPLRYTELRSVQAFIFDCWLTWGPSIPICTCECWGTAIEALQLGYGDENNSVPLVRMPPVGTDRVPSLYAQFDEFLRRLGDIPANKVAPPLALQVTVVGRPAWGPSVDRARVPPALQGIRDGLVLEYIGAEPFEGTRVDKARVYYSAYLWVIFVIQRPDGTALFPPDESRPNQGEMWRGLLTFFEHGNIADGGTYDFMQEQLARKALAGLARLAENTATDGWRFAYACAVDDPGCAGGRDSRRFPVLPPGAASGGPRAARSLRQRLVERLDAEFSALSRSRRVILDPRTDPVYSACHLTENIQAFYEAVKTREEVKNQEAVGREG